MKKSNNHYAASLLIATTLVLTLHYLFIAKLAIHPTIHVALGLFGYLIILTLTSDLLKKYI